LEIGVATGVLAFASMAASAGEFLICDGAPGKTFRLGFGQGIGNVRGGTRASWLQGED
jgi:hypothetical protein